MKYVICHSNYDVLNKNGNMLNGVGDVSVKDFLRQMSELKAQGLTNDVDFRTSGEIPLAEADAFIFVDMPNPTDGYLLSAMETGKPLFLLAWESAIINPRNTIKKYHHLFKVIFTYDDTYIDNDRYIKLPYSFEFPKIIYKSYRQKKLCCLIAGNKASSHPLELYSHRLDIIKWFEVNHLQDFDLFGQGWRKIIPPKNIFHRFVNKFSFINRFMKVQRPSYCGEVTDKIKTYQKYKFAICYENAKDLPGYVSEKIFDCFFAGCVPVYWGAPNITQHIPESCFIDRRKFASNQDLYAFISGMSEVEYFGYLDSIDNFLEKNKDGIFSVDYFAKSLINNILKWL